MENERVNRLTMYYSRIMEAAGKSIDEAKLNKFLQTLDVNKIDEIEMDSLRESQVRRLSAYASVLSSLQKKLADEMEQIMNSLGDYNFDTEKKVVINGNTFIYAEGFPIEEFRLELSDIGNHENGAVYSVDLDDGKLVVY